MKYASFGEFYPYYLSEHRRSGTRPALRGTLLVLVALGCVLATSAGVSLAAAAVRYGFAWLGHFAVERNRPGRSAPALQPDRRLPPVRRHAARPRAFLN